MTYSVYRKILDKETFFRTYYESVGRKVTEKEKAQIYSSYTNKCVVFQRDGFKCQNIGCHDPHKDLTIHHLRWQWNDGENKPVNCVTICKKCHVKYHNASGHLSFPKDATYLPKRYRGMTYKLIVDKPWFTKEKKAELKKLRHQIQMDMEKSYMTYQQLLALIRWLEQPSVHLSVSSNE